MISLLGFGKKLSAVAAALEPVINGGQRHTKHINCIGLAGKGPAVISMGRARGCTPRLKRSFAAGVRIQLLIGLPTFAADIFAR